MSSRFFFFWTLLDVVVDFDQVVWFAAVFPKTGLFWANDVFCFHEPGEAGCNDLLD
jgi:hypothetical protein